jgi:hypothetical protein
MSLYFDPYKNKPCRSIRAEVAEEDLAFLDEVIPAHGIKMHLIRLAIFTVCNDIRTAGITEFSIDNHEKAYELIKRRFQPELVQRSNPVPDARGPLHDASRGTPEVHPTDSTNPSHDPEHKGRSTTVKRAKVKQDIR